MGLQRQKTDAETGSRKMDRQSDGVTKGRSSAQRGSRQQTK